jgi:hypothetical protein
MAHWTSATFVLPVPLTSPGGVSVDATVSPANAKVHDTASAMAAARWLLELGTISSGGDAAGARPGVPILQALRLRSSKSHQLRV